MGTQVSHEEKVEAARARVKTAYDLMMGTDVTSSIMPQRIEKYNDRKAELQALVTPKPQYNE